MVKPLHLLTKEIFTVFLPKEGLPASLRLIRHTITVLFGVKMANLWLLPPTALVILMYLRWTLRVVQKRDSLSTAQMKHPILFPLIIRRAYLVPPGKMP